MHCCSIYTGRYLAHCKFQDHLRAAHRGGGAFFRLLACCCYKICKHRPETGFRTDSGWDFSNRFDSCCDHKTQTIGDWHAELQCSCTIKMLVFTLSVCYSLSISLYTAFLLAFLSLCFAFSLAPLLPFVFTFLLLPLSVALCVDRLSCR